MKFQSGKPSTNTGISKDGMNSKVVMHIEGDDSDDCCGVMDEEELDKSRKMRHSMKRGAETGINGGHLRLI